MHTCRMAREAVLQKRISGIKETPAHSSQFLGRGLRVSRDAREDDAYRTTRADRQRPLAI